MSPDQRLVPGMVLGRYELLVPIASGGMATVWAARQRGTRGFNKTVAIKTMLPALTDDVQFEQMFLDEAALAARIHHPNVAEILDLGEQDDILYIVMEWVEGEALSVLQKMARNNGAQVPLGVIMRICLQACAALHAAHELRDENDRELQLVHRDVSPQNILCTYDGIVKLVDFGVAKAIGRAGGETVAGQLKGKVPFMSPEQARGGALDRRTDIFALGIVMYKLATGLHPFHGASDVITMRNIISRPLIRPRVRTPSFPEDVERIIVKCLEKDPERRYQTMLELRQAVSLTGAGTSDDDIGAFVRSTMGDRGIKRRAEIREAVRAADERYATGVHSRVSIPSPSSSTGATTISPTQESLTDAALTQMKSSVQDGILVDPGPSRASDAPNRGSDAPSRGSDAPVSASGVAQVPRASGSWPSQLATPSLTERAVEVAAFGGRSRFREGKRSGWLLGAAAAVAAAVLSVVALRASHHRSALGARAPTRPVASVDDRALSRTAPPVPLGDAPPPPLQPTAETPQVPTTTPTAWARGAPTSPAGLAEKLKPRVRGPLPAAPAAKPEAENPGKTISGAGEAPIYTNPGF